MKKTKNATNVPQLFLSFINKKALSRPIGWMQAGELKYHSHKEYYSLVRNLSMSLKKLGVEKGTKVALISQTRKEWHYLDLAIMCAGGVVVPVFPSYDGEELQYILNQSDSQVIIVENDHQFSKVNKLSLDHSPQIISINEVNEDILSFSDISIKSFCGYDDLDAHFLASIEILREEDIASIIYTSGTTGEPKGVVLSHSSIIAMLANVYDFLKFHIQKDDTSLVFLPLSHVLGRCDSLTGLRFGIQKIYAESTDKVIENLSLVRPSILIAVPRIFEKIYEMIITEVNSSPVHKRKLFQWALNSSKKYFDKLDLDRSPSSSEIIQRNLAYKLVFKNIYDKFGGSIRFFVSGGAPLSEEIVQFLRYCNLTVLEGYGLTETIAPCTLNPVNKQYAGTVGLPLGDVQVRFEADGEILIKSKALFREYYKRPDLTKEALSPDGWFRTGDIGFLTSNGFLKITDRKKDLIITSGGKNVAPQKLEAIFQKEPLIAHFIPVGDNRKFLAGLVAIEREAFNPIIEELGLPRHIELKSLVEHPRVCELIAEAINAANQTLPSFERIRKFHILPIELTIENNLLTPSLKVRKKAVMTLFQREIDSMYQ